MKKQADYVVLARKYRPQGFEEVLGQPAVSVTLKNALSSKRLHHAYLFTGPRGVGKTTMARILAKALNCVGGPTAEPCGECDPCREIAGSSSLDVLEMDAASHTGVDNVRQVIIDTVALAPSRDRYKVFIIDEAHMLSTAAFNALLKTLEEPPPHVVFVLATTESAKVPATIASRCQRFKFRPVPVELLAQHLAALAKKEKMTSDPAALELLARSAEGSLRDAVSLLDQCHSAGGGKITEELVRDMFGFVPQDLLLGVAGAILAKDAPELARWLKKVHDEGVEAAQLLRDLRTAFEALYLEKLGLEPSVDKLLRPLASEGSAETFSFLLRRLNKTLEELRFGDSPRLILELGLFGCLEAAGDLQLWVERLEALEKRLSAGTGVPAEPRPSQPPPVAPATAVRSSVAAPPPMPVVAAPVAAAAVGGTPAQIWASVMAAIRQDKAALASTLEKAQLHPGGASWRLAFARPFDLESAKRGQALIEAKLATFAGRAVRLTLELGQFGHSDPASEVVEPSVTSAPEGGAEGAWSDVKSQDAPAGGTPPAGSLQKAQQILGGKMRIVKKPQP